MRVCTNIFVLEVFGNATSILRLNSNSVNNGSIHHYRLRLYQANNTEKVKLVIK